MNKELSKAELRLFLKSPSGYSADVECNVTLEQWARINEIIDEPDGPASPAAKAGFRKVTTEEVKAAVRAAKKGSISRFFRIRDCSICNTPIGYEAILDNLVFHSSCDCVSYSVPPELRPWPELAELVNMQTTVEGRKFLTDLFCLPEDLA
jgi:hypothetical protein